MARYMKNSIGNNWDKTQDPTALPAKPGDGQQPRFYVLCWTDDGRCLNCKSYEAHEEELAQLAFAMNKAALIENPRLLPERTTQVVLKRGNDIIDHTSIETAEAA